MTIKFAGASMAAAALLTLMVLPVGLEAQVELRSRAARLTITGRVHTQWNHTSVNSEISSTFFVRRARLTAEIKINDFISGKVQPEYGEGAVSLRDAYVDLTFDPAFRWRIGQFKRPFDRFELVSSTQILVIERAGGVRGVPDCAGVGNVCSFSRFTEKLNFSDRDIGFEFLGNVGKFMWSASVTNGRGPNNRVDENGTKSYSGRLEYRGDGLTIGGNFGVHDYTNDSTGTDKYAPAFGVDVDWGQYEQPGVHLKAGFVYGDNWKNLTTADPSKFMTTQAIAAYMFGVKDNPFLYGIEPVFRVSYGDPDTDTAGDDGWLWTPGIAAYFSGRNKLALNFDIWSPATGGTQWSTKAQVYLHF
jgi:Phosphate-selective porin O and P